MFLYLCDLLIWGFDYVDFNRISCYFKNKIERDMYNFLNYFR